MFVTLTKTLYFNIFPGLQFDDIYTSCLFWDWLTIYRVKSLPRRHINPFSWWILITDACFNSSSAFFRGVVGGTNNTLARRVSVAKWRDHPLRFGCFACFSLLFFFFIYIYFWQGLERSATEHRKTGNKRVTTANQKKGRYLRFWIKQICCETWTHVYQDV